MKKIYFACSIRSGRHDQPIYAKIVELIKEHATVLSEVFADKKLTSDGHTHMTTHQIWEWDVNWIKEADALIAEVSTPSLGIGYEIALAETLGKPILALYRPQTGKLLSAMIDGNPNINVHHYSKTEQLPKIIDKFMSEL